MLTSITVGNFKAFGPPQTLQLKPLTLLFGPNSAGKSSFLQAVVLMQHILNTGNFNPHKIPGTQIDLGGFLNYVHLRDPQKQVQLGFTFSRTPTLNQSITCKIGQPYKEESLGLHGVTYLLDHQFELEFETDAAFPQSLPLKPLKLKRVQQLDVPSHPDSQRSHSLQSLYHQVQQAFPVQDPHSGRLDHMVCTLLKDHMVFSETEWLECRVPQVNPLATPEDLVALRNHWRTLRKAIQERPATLESLKIPEIPKVFANVLEKNLLPLRELLGFHRSDKKKNNSAIDHVLNFLPLNTMTNTQFEDLLDIYTLVFLLHQARETSEHLLQKLFELNLDLRLELHQVTHLGPLREYPERTETVINDSSGPGKVARGLHQKPEALQAINRWLGGQGGTGDTGYHLKVIGLYEIDETTRIPHEHPSHFRVSLYDEQKKQEVSFRDVGVGISQIVPVLVQAYTTSSGVHFIEQPELHLHPRLQTHLADAFLENLRNQAFVLETHSEHLILRVLRRVREHHSIQPEDISVVYVQPTRQGSQLVQLRVSHEGDFLDPWPEGFFQERVQELF